MGENYIAKSNAQFREFFGLSASPEDVYKWLGYKPEPTKDDVEDALREIVDAYEAGEISDAFFQDAIDIVSGLTD